MEAYRNNNLYGILLIILNSAALAALYAGVKFTSGYIGSNITVFLYKTLILLMIIPWVFKDGFRSIITPQLKLHMIRGFLSITGSLSFMYALQRVNMVDATALSYLEQITLVIVGVLYFKEGITKSKIFCVMASFLGAFIILYPDALEFNLGWPLVIVKQRVFENFNSSYLFTLLAVLCWSVNSTVVKIMGRTERTKTQLFYVTLFSCIFAFPFAFIEWKLDKVFGFDIFTPVRMVTWKETGLCLWHLKYIAMISACYFIHNVAFFRAFKYSEMSTLVPFEYTKLIFIGLLQYFIFGIAPADSSYPGYILIVISGVILAKSEAARKKKRKLAEEARRLNDEYEHA